MISAINYLISMQHETGGWGYSAGANPVVEPTAVVLLAIRDEPLASNALQKGVAWLKKIQHADGGWGINEKDQESGWQTAWALIALKKLNQASELVSRGEDWLLTVGTVEISQEEFKNLDIPLDNINAAYIWPWLPAQGGWIEPTALALLALGGINKSPLAEIRKNAAIRFFREYRTPSGGWDAGNAGPLDTIVLPRAFQTALVLMALAQVEKEEIKDIDISALRKDLQNDSSVLVRSIGLLALRILSVDEDTVASQITERQLSDGSWDANLFATALAIMGLRGYI